MAEDIVIKIEGEEPQPAEHIEEKEDEEWMILLGELKANTEAHHLAMEKLALEVSLLNASVEDQKRSHQERKEWMEKEQEGLLQRLGALERAEIVEEVEEAPEVPEVQKEEESPARKRPNLIA